MSASFTSNGTKTSSIELTLIVSALNGRASGRLRFRRIIAHACLQVLGSGGLPLHGGDDAGRSFVRLPGKYLGASSGGELLVRPSSK